MFFFHSNTGKKQAISGLEPLRCPKAIEYQKSYWLLHNFTTFLCIGVVSEHKHILNVDASSYIYINVESHPNRSQHICIYEHKDVCINIFTYQYASIHFFFKSWCWYLCKFDRLSVPLYFSLRLPDFFKPEKTLNLASLHKVNNMLVLSKIGCSKSRIL